MNYTSIQEIFPLNRCGDVRHPKLKKSGSGEKKLLLLQGDRECICFYDAQLENNIKRKVISSWGQWKYIATK